VSLHLTQHPQTPHLEIADPLYVVVEGPIGVGKTTLVHRLRKRMNAHLVLEVVEENPFLAYFYNHPERYAFQTQLFFLMSRFRQQKELREQGVHQDCLADYHLLKDRIFAELTLKAEELELYETVYHSLATCVRKPDVLVYLHADEGALLKRIHQRARPFEKNFDRHYLSRLSERYLHHFNGYQETPLLKLNTTKIDYVTNDQPVNEIYQEIHRLASAHRSGLTMDECISSNFA
jgi:deoxyadenosine/deoxycytidine kinase